jgi:hypothetical protein
LIVLNESRRISDVISTGALERSEFIDFMQQVPYRHAMGALTGLAHRAVAVVSVHRQGRDFNQEELAVFDRVGPHLARAVVLRRLANDTLQRAETGIAVFAGNGRALYLSEPARRFIGRTPAEALFTALSPEGSGVIRIGSQSYRLSRLPWSTPTPRLRARLHWRTNGHFQEIYGRIPRLAPRMPAEAARSRAEVRRTTLAFTNIKFQKPIRRCEWPAGGFRAPPTGFECPR